MGEREERRERANRLWREVTTGEPPKPGDAYMEFTLDHVFGDVWSRPGLTRKERRWITLTCAAMSGSAPAIEGHVRGALASGDISLDEMLEFTVHFAHYAGWPLSATLYTAVRKHAAQLGGGG